MECNIGTIANGTHTAMITLITGSGRFRINSRDNSGRTMLHIAVIEGNLNVVTQILDLRTEEFGEDPKNDKLNVNIVDDEGRTPADYLEDIENAETRMEIQNALAGAGAIYGQDGQHIAIYDDDTGVLTYGNHGPNSPVGVVEGFPPSTSPS
jgi:hypothetical protein